MIILSDISRLVDSTPKFDERGWRAPFSKMFVAMDGGDKRTGKYSQRFSKRGPSNLLTPPKHAG